MAISNARTGYLNGTTSGWAAKSLFRDGLNYYAVILNTSAVVIEVHKSTDGGVTWTEQDSSNSRSHSGATHSYDACTNAVLNDRKIYVAYRTATNTIRVRAFDMSTDTWAGADIGAANASTSARETHGLDLTIRSDGDIVLNYNYNTSADWRQTFWDGSSWGGVNSNSVDAFPHGSVVTDADITHSWAASSGTTYHQPISAANARGTRNSLDTSTTQAFSNFPGYVNDGGTHRICGLSIDSTGEMDFYYSTSSTNVTFSTVGSLSPTSTTNPGRMGGVCVAYNSKWYAIWSGAGRGSIHMDASDDLTSPAFTTDTDVITGLGNDPAVYAISAPSGIPVLYTDFTGPSVDLIWAVGAAAVDATGTVSAQAIPVTGATVTGTAGTADTGTVAGSAIVVTGGTVTGSAETVVDATGTVTAQNIPVTGASVTGTAGQAATGAVSVQSVPVTGGTVTGTAGQSATGTVTVQAIPVTGGTVTGTAGSTVDATGTVTAQNIPVSGATVAASAGIGVTAIVTGQTITIAGGSVIGSTSATGQVVAQSITVSGFSVTGSSGATGIVTAQNIPLTGGSVLGIGSAGPLLFGPVTFDVDSVPYISFDPDSVPYVTFQPDSLQS